MSFRCSAVTCVLLAACGGSPAPAAQPVAPLPPAQPETEPEAPLPEPQLPEPEPEAPPPVETQTGGPTLDEIRNRLQPRLSVDEQALLALPGSWPPLERQLRFYVYRTEPLPTGRVTYQVRGPFAVITVHVHDGSMRREELDMPQMTVLRPDDPQERQVDRRAAEALLLEVVAGRKPADEADDELKRRYCPLLDDGRVGEDLRSRAPKFVAWLACDRAHR